MLSADFSEILSSLSEENAEYLVVGAYALAAHGIPRATGDLDIWVRPTVENAERVWRALTKFGAPADRFSVTDLTLADVVVQIGVAPNRVDVLTAIDGVEFDEAWEDRMNLEVSGLVVPVLAREHLIQNKRATARQQDLVDVARLLEKSPPTS